MNFKKTGVIVATLLFLILFIKYSAAISGSGSNLDMRIEMGSVSINSSGASSSDARGENFQVGSVIASGDNSFLRTGVINFSLDVPKFNSVQELNPSLEVVSSTNPLITGQELTLNANISSANTLSSVVLNVWLGGKNHEKVIQVPLSLSSGLYNASLAINYTYPYGVVNYTLVANNSIRASGEYDDSIMIYYNASALTTTHSSTVEYGSNISLRMGYNLTNSTYISGAVCNVTINNVIWNLAGSNNLYQASVNSTPFGLGNENINWSCSRDYHIPRNISSNFSVVDTTAPVISNIVISPSADNITVNDKVIINATVSDTLISMIWIETDYSGGFVNYTNNSGGVDKSGSVYTYTIGKGNLTSYKTVQYRWYANDTTGNVINSSLYNFTVLNRAPGIPTLNNPRDDDDILFENTTLFTWNSTDTDADSLLYNFQIANLDTFSDSSLIVNTTVNVTSGLTTSNGNYSFTPGTQPTGVYYWRARVKDNGAYS